VTTDASGSLFTSGGTGSNSIAINLSELDLATGPAHRIVTGGTNNARVLAQRYDGGLSTDGKGIYFFGFTGRRNPAVPPYPNPPWPNSSSKTTTGS
jgi:hypothetical protein